MIFANDVLDMIFFLQEMNIPYLHEYSSQNYS